MKLQSLMMAGAVLALLPAQAESYSFSLSTMPASAIFEVNTLTKYGSNYALDTYPSPRTITDVNDVLPLAHWGSGTITVKLGDVTKDTLTFSADGTTVWKPTEKGTWTLVYSVDPYSATKSSVFNVSSIAFIDGDGDKETPKTAEDGEAVEYLIAEQIAKQEETGNNDPVYITVGDDSGEPVEVALDDGDDDSETVAAVEIPAGTTIAVDGNGTITIPEGTTVVVSVNGVQTPVDGLAAIRQGTGGISVALSWSDCPFELATMDEAARFSLNTMVTDSIFYVETMDVNHVRSITNAVQVLPIAHWGAGTLTFAHEDGTTVTHDFTEDGTYVWQPSLSGKWTVTTTGDALTDNKTAIFILAGGCAEVESVLMSGIDLAANGGIVLAFRPTLKDGATMSKDDWFASARASGLIKIRAATSIDALDTDAATLVDLKDLDAEINEDTVTFNLTGEKMQELFPNANCMFFKVEIH